MAGFGKKTAKEASQDQSNFCHKRLNQLGRGAPAGRAETRGAYAERLFELTPNDYFHLAQREKFRVRGTPRQIGGD